MIIFFTAGLGLTSEETDEGKELRGSTMLAGLLEQQKIVDSDPGITAFKIFKLDMINQQTGAPQPMEYRLPILVPTPDPATHTFHGRKVSESLATLQFAAMDGSHVVTLLVDHNTLEGVALSFNEVKDDLWYRYLYDADGNPQPASQKAIIKVIENYGVRVGS
jgi:hypothetical protein